jgi:hypothetical protein
MLNLMCIGDQRLTFAYACCSIFGVGFQSIPIFTWILFPVALYYSRSAWSNLLPLYIANVFGNVLALLGCFNLDPTPGYADVGLLIGRYFLYIMKEC